MPDQDQTTQPTDEQTTREGVDATTEQIQSQNAAAESGSQQEESIDWKARYEEGSRKITELGQKASQLEQALQAQAAMNQQYRESLSAFGNERAAQTDPEAAAWNDYLAAKRDFDGDAEANALQRWATARDAKREQDILNKAIQQQRMMSELPTAQTMLGVQDQNVLAHELQGVASTLTPSELALVALKRKGRLNDYVAKETAAEKAAREQAEALRALPGLGGGKGVPGQAAPAAQSISFEEWSLLTDESKQRIRESDEDWVVYGGPKHFDPMKH